MGAVVGGAFNRGAGFGDALEEVGEVPAGGEEEGGVVQTGSAAAGLRIWGFSETEEFGGGSAEGGGVALAF